MLAKKQRKCDDNFKLHCWRQVHCELWSNDQVHLYCPISCFIHLNLFGYIKNKSHMHVYLFATLPCHSHFNKGKPVTGHTVWLWGEKYLVWTVTLKVHSFNLIIWMCISPILRYSIWVGRQEKIGFTRVYTGIHDCCY